MDSTWEKRYPAATVAATALLFYLKDLHTFLLVEKFAGRDLVSNYAFVKLMKSNMLNGKIFSWSPEWFLGVPSFELYPPVFFIITALIDIITGNLIGTAAIFKIMTFLSIFLVPLAFYMCFSKFFGEKESFVGALFSLLFIFVHEPISQAYLVLSTGLVAQGLSYLFTVIATGLALRKERKFKMAGGIILGISFLTHPFASTTGFLVIGAYCVITGRTEDLIPALIGGGIGLPWLLNAAFLMRFTPSYTMPPADPGLYIALILPLAVLGGLRDRRSKAVLGGFIALLSVSIIELPVVTQELRFYTYSLGLGTFLAGLGVFKLAENASERLDIDKNLFLILMLIPVFSLSMQAEVSELWSFEGSSEQLFEELEQMDQGRVIVETENDSIRDAFVLQARIPLETDHYVVNDVHYDSSTSANYILTLESWISSDPVRNSICRTCDTEVSDEVVSDRIDSLGIRYIVTKTEESTDRMKEIAEFRGKHGEYWLFENTEGYRRNRNVNSATAIEGGFSDWRKLNDRLFRTSITRKIYWSGKEDEGPSISLKDNTEDEILKAIRSGKNSTELDSTHVKRSQYPGMKGKFANFNTAITLETP